MIEDRDLLEKFVPRIRDLPEGELKKEDVLVPDFLLDKEGNVEIYYAPFHYTNEQACVVMVGITPGWTQTEISFRRTRHYILQGNSPPEACRLSDQIAIPEAFTANFCVVRALLQHGRSYEQAVKMFEPYREVQQPDHSTRAALRQVSERALRTGQRAYIFVNNRLEGNAPGSIEAVVSGGL